ncbi:MAG TPA: hypothetical protein VFB89_10940 [Gemmatimonadales bacterium]|nr:hypothetical protein [Gemmatimonadales bacterium]
MRLAGLLVLPLIVGLAACSDSSLAPLPTDLSGSYNLQSIQISSVTEPSSNGTLQLGTSSYDLALTINGQIQPEDVGTYAIGNPNTWVQTSTTTGVQSFGSFSLSGSTLTITLTSPESTVMVWTKVPQR